MATEQGWYKNKYKSLVGLLQENRRVNKVFQKRNKSFKIALIVEAVAFAAYILFFVIIGMRNFSRDTRNFALVLCLATILIFSILDVFLWYINIYKPKIGFIKKAKTVYPGVDLRSESSIKNYLWTFKDRELLFNLVPLIVWEAAERNAGGFVEPNTYTDAERVVLDVWRTNSIDQELYDLYFHDEHERAYLESAVASFYTIGADDEAKVWTEARELFSRVEKLAYDAELAEPNDTDIRTDGHYYIYSINGIDGEVRFACGKEERACLIDLKQKHTACRMDTERKLYNYVMEHKDEFKFGVDNV